MGDRGYRAQVLGVGGWVDGGLFVRRKDAQADAENLAALYETDARVVGDPQLDLEFQEAS